MEHTTHLKTLSMKGCMVSKDALQHLTDENVEKILNLKTTPMLINKRLLQNLEQMEAA